MITANQLATAAKHQMEIGVGVRESYVLAAIVALGNPDTYELGKATGLEHSASIATKLAKKGLVVGTPGPRNLKTWSATEKTLNHLKK